MHDPTDTGDIAESDRRDLDFAAAERALDGALEESFSASDPAAITRRA